MQDKQASSISLNPTPEQLMVRARERALRLKQAIQNEESKAAPNLERLEDLKAELTQHKAYLQSIVEGVI